MSGGKPPCFLWRRKRGGEGTPAGVRFGFLYFGGDSMSEMMDFMCGAAIVLAVFYWSSL